MDEAVSQKEMMSAFNKNWLKLLCLAACAICTYLYVRAESRYQDLSKARDQLIQNKNTEQARHTMAEYPRVSPVFMDFAISHRVLPSPDVFDKIFNFAPERMERKKVEALFDSLFENRGDEENMKHDVKRSMYTQPDSVFNQVWEETVPQLIHANRTTLIDSLYRAMLAIRKDEIDARNRALDAYIKMIKGFSPDRIEELRKGIDFYARKQGLVDVANHYHPEIRRKGYILRSLIGL